MSEDFRFRDLRQDILAVELDDIVDDVLRCRVKKFVNSKNEQRLCERARAQGVSYGSSHSLVKGLYSRLAKERVGMPHTYFSNAKRVVDALRTPLIPNAAQWAYVDAKRNGLIATIDDVTCREPLASLELEGLCVSDRAHKIITALFGYAARQENPSLKPFQIGYDKKVLSAVSKYFSPRKDPESLLLLYLGARQNPGCPDEER